MLEYEIEARRADPSGSKATAKDAELVLDTSLARGVDHSLDQHHHGLKPIVAQADCAR